MNRLRLKEAEAFYTQRNAGEEIGDQIAKELSPESSPAQQKQTRWKLLNGRKKTFTIKEVKTICRLTGVDMNFLFGYEK